MSKVHINSNGEPGACKATTKPCPFGDDSTHFSSNEEAAAAYSEAQEIMGNSSFGVSSKGIGESAINYVFKHDAMKVANLITNEGKFAAISTTYTDYVEGIPEESDYESYDEYQTAVEDFEDRASAGDVEVSEGSRLYQVKAFETFEDAKNAESSSWDPDSDFPTASVTIGDADIVSQGDMDYNSMQGTLKRIEVEFIAPKKRS
jgi:hypothetical protein